MNEQRQRADLHVHSYFSDGLCSPTKLVSMAEEQGLLGLSVTDHDTIAGYQEAAQAAQRSEVLVLPGIEISAQLGAEPIHILGYAFDPASPSLKDMCAIHRERRLARNRQILEKLTQCGVNLSMDEVYEESPHAYSYGRPHIAMALVKRGYVSSPFEAFQRYLKEGRCGYVAGQKWTIDEAIGVIHQSKGYAVLAHPHLIKEGSYIPELFTYDFDGLEAYYGDHHENTRWGNIAKERGLFVTGGSDFHGNMRVEGSLGGSWTPRETFYRLYEHFVSVLKDSMLFGGFSLPRTMLEI